MVTSGGAKPQGIHSLQLASLPLGGVVVADDIFTSCFFLVSEEEKSGCECWPGLVFCCFFFFLLHVLTTIEIYERALALVSAGFGGSPGGHLKILSN